MHYTSQETIDLIVSLRKEGIEILNPQKTKEELTSQASCARKTKLKAYKGGKCIVCGYNKSIRALQFHHLDPTQKDFGISGTTKSFEKLKPELDKCVLLCANCHGEVHEGLLDINKFI